jgi:hypothetical protein
MYHAKHVKRDHRYNNYILLDLLKVSPYNSCGWRCRKENPGYRPGNKLRESMTGKSRRTSMDDTSHESRAGSVKQISQNPPTGHAPKTGWFFEELHSSPVPGLKTLMFPIAVMQESERLPERHDDEKGASAEIRISMSGRDLTREHAWILQNSGGREMISPVSRTRFQPVENLLPAHTGNQHAFVGRC